MEDPWATSITSLLEEDHGDSETSDRAECISTALPDLMSDTSNHSQSTSPSVIRTCPESMEDIQALGNGPERSGGQESQYQGGASEQGQGQGLANVWMNQPTLQWDPQNLSFGNTNDAGPSLDGNRWQQSPNVYSYHGQPMYAHPAYGCQQSRMHLTASHLPGQMNLQPVRPSPQDVLGMSVMGYTCAPSQDPSQMQPDEGVDPKEVIPDPFTAPTQSMQPQAQNNSALYDPYSYSADSSPQITFDTDNEPLTHFLTANSGSSSSFPLIQPQEVEPDSPPLQSLPFGSRLYQSPQLFMLDPGPSHFPYVHPSQSPTASSHHRPRRKSAHHATMSSGTSKSPETYNPTEMADSAELDELEKLRQGGSALKKDKRRLQNRFAQRAFRARSRVQRKEADGYVNNIEERVDAQQAELNNMRAIISRLQTENAELARRDASNSSFQSK